MTAQNIALLTSKKKAKTPDVTLKFTVARGFSAERANIVPPVNNKLTPPKILINNRISSKRHQLYNPNATKALAIIAMILGNKFSFIISSFYTVGGVGGIGGAAGAKSEAKSGRLAAGSHAAIP